jgi:hypothetical protein
MCLVHSDSDLKRDVLTPFSYKSIERDHRFLRSKRTGKVFRENAIYQQSFDKRTGNMVSDDLLYQNHCETLYALPVATPAVEIE